MIDDIPIEYFKDVKANELMEVKSHNILITFQGNIVDMNELISNYKPGDRFLIQYKLNFRK